jgi:hypothetical protein
MTEETNVAVDMEKAETETESETSSGSKTKLTEETSYPNRKWIFVTLVSLIVLAAVIAGASIAAGKNRTKQGADISADEEEYYNEDTSSSSDEEEYHHVDEGEEHPCLSTQRSDTWKMDFYAAGGCDDFNYTAMVKELNGKIVRYNKECPHGAPRELKLVFGVAPVVLRMIIKAKCRVETHPKDEIPFDMNLLSYDFDDPMPFGKLLVNETYNKLKKGNNVWLKAFFDGGTSWNDERETTADDGETVYNLGGETTKIHSGYYPVAKHHAVRFPNDISNFQDCAIRAAMCCYVQDRQADDEGGSCEEPYDENCVDADPRNNTDICLVDMARAPESSRVPGGFAIFPEDQEGATHCHGFAWSDDEMHPSNLYKGNTLYYIAMWYNLRMRGYVKNVPGAPMCGCVEQVRAGQIIFLRKPVTLDDVVLSLFASFPLSFVHTFSRCPLCREPTVTRQIGGICWSSTPRTARSELPKKFKLSTTCATALMATTRLAISPLTMTIWWSRVVQRKRKERFSGRRLLETEDARPRSTPSSLVKRECPPSCFVHGE